MTYKREFSDYINDMYDAINKIQIFSKNMNFEEFISDDKTIYAVIRCFEIIGEATKKIPKIVKEKYTTVPWQEISGIRDKLIHEYFGVNLEVVWKTILEDLPELKINIEKIVDEMNQIKG